MVVVVVVVVVLMVVAAALSPLILLAGTKTVPVERTTKSSVCGKSKKKTGEARLDEGRCCSVVCDGGSCTAGGVACQPASQPAS